MPRKIISDEPPPSPPRTFPISAFRTPRAIPIRLPSTSRPKMVPAQCDPCPCRSPLPEPLKSFSTIVTPAKAGWFLSMPVSNTATTTPSPVTGEVVALTASMPHASPAAATAAVMSNGLINLIGIGMATAATLGSRAALKASCKDRSCVSIRGSGGVVASGPTLSRPLAAALRRTMNSGNLHLPLGVKGVGKRVPHVCSRALCEAIAPAETARGLPEGVCHADIH